MKVHTQRIFILSFIISQVYGTRHDGPFGQDLQDGSFCECRTEYHSVTEDEQRIMGLQEGILSCQLSNHPDKHYNATHCYSPKGRCYRRLDHRHGQGDLFSEEVDKCDYKLNKKEYGCIYFEKQSLDEYYACNVQNVDSESICCSDGDNCNSDVNMGLSKNEERAAACQATRRAFWIIGGVGTAIFVFGTIGIYICKLGLPAKCVYICKTYGQSDPSLINEYDPEYPCIYKRGDESKIVRGDPINECPSNNTTVSNLPSSLYCSSDMVFELGSEKGPAVLVQRTISRQIEILGLKGNGRYGEVYHGKWQGTDVAVKKFHAWDDKSWQREYEIYTTLTHQNILGFIAADNKDNGQWTELWLITDYHERGSIYDYLSENTVSPVEAVKMLYTAVCGLEHMHKEIVGTSGKHGMAHRDVKAKNILIKNNGECCIGDLGLAIRDDYFKSHNYELEPNPNLQVGTKRYMAPEILSNTIDQHQFNNFKKADIYSMALVMWEVLRRTRIGNQETPEYQHPYYDHVETDPNIDEMKNIVVKYRHRPEFDDEIYEPENEMLHQIVVLIEECWMHEPGGRLPSLRLKKNLGSIFKEMTILTGENPAATGANKHIQNIVHGSTNDSAVSVTTPTHSGTRDSPVTT